jgi:hypothetical protein
MKKRFMVISVIGCIVVSSCTTYYIPVDSLKQQFAGIDSTKFKEVIVKGPVYERYQYLANPIERIQCVDKKGTPHQMTNSPSIETRFTYGYKNKRKVFYFDRIYVDNNSVFGVESRFIESIRNSIPLDSITKIEVQNGHKKFTYINR